ncbi:hypothetical protein KKD19_00410 [Patescibacteria group bacterium]|nr:hypothetical protein [Patescibacteria group bacterium]
MKEKIKKNNWLNLVVVLLLISVFVFCWYEWRSRQIKIECYKISQDEKVSSGGRLFPEGSILQVFNEKRYGDCLKIMGL